MNKFVFLLLASLSLQAATIYQVNRTVGAGFVVGTITTDDTVGFINGSNILAWNLTINNGSTSAQLSNILANHNVSVPGTLFSATATQLLFDFSGGAGSYAFFRDNNTNNFWCIESSSCASLTSAETVRIGNNDATAARSGSVVIANTGNGSAVPEPSTWALVALSGSALALLRRVR